MMPKRNNAPMNFALGDTEVAVNVPGPGPLLQAVAEHLRQGRGFAVATLNLDHLVKLARDPAFAAAYAAHDLVVADGRPVVWLSRLAGRPVALAPGSDLVLPLCQTARDAEAPVALIGSTADVLDRAAADMMARVPGLRVVLTEAPSYGFDPEGPEADAILARVADTGARLCLIALGAPKQERFAARARGIVPAAGFVSVGAGIDFVAGHQRRAPAWVRAAAIEWLWRTLQSPARMAPRYAACFAILPRLVLGALRQRRRAG